MKEWIKYMAYGCQIAGFALLVPGCNYAIDFFKEHLKLDVLYLCIAVSCFILGTWLLAIGYIILKRRFEL